MEINASITGPGFCGSTWQPVGGDDGDVHAGPIWEFGVAAYEGGVFEAAGGYDVESVVDGEVIA